MRDSTVVRAGLGATSSPGNGAGFLFAPQRKLIKIFADYDGKYISSWSDDLNSVICEKPADTAHCHGAALMWVPWWKDGRAPGTPAVTVSNVPGLHRPK